jgi:hypothetical protein
MTKLAMIAALAVAACGNKAADKPALECGPVISGAIDRMLADAKTNLKLTPEAVARVEGVAPKMKDAIAKVCTEDKWAAAALECLAGANSQRDMNECEHKLTTEQKARTEAVRSAILDGVKAKPPAPVPTVPTSQP